MKVEFGLTALLIPISIFLSRAAELRAPGKPQITNCRSPEKETFTCWWEPGEDGGLYTTYALYYRLEGSDTEYECSDYKTAGPNSCFFNKKDTLVWVNYNITVVARNALGWSVSEPVEVDVVYIVQPNTPENVMAVIIDDVHPPYARVLWDKPRSADTRSGWITLVYQLRVKRDKDDDWEECNAGMQKYYNVFSLLSGEEYMVQVRCKPDHGFWSEWTSPVYVQMPDFMPAERNMWILVIIFIFFIFFIIIWIMSVKSSSVKLCLLPPVPGPKIRGFDQQLLKSGKSDEAFSALVIQSFPPTSYEELLVDYLEVCDGKDEQELISASKEQPSKSSSTSSDCDSGRGSCDSRTLVMEKCSRDAELDSPVVDESVLVISSSQHSRQRCYQQDLHFQRPRNPSEFYHNVPEISCISSSVQISKARPSRHAQSVSECSQYVEVQTVDRENLLLLRPLTDAEAPGPDPSLSSAGQSYSKVQDVTADNLLLLQRNPNDYGGNFGDYCECRSEPADVWRSQRLENRRKPDAFSPSIAVMLEGTRVTGNGYVDSTVMSS